MEPIQKERRPAASLAPPPVAATVENNHHHHKKSITQHHGEITTTATTRNSQSFNSTSLSSSAWSSSVDDPDDPRPPPPSRGSIQHDMQQQQQQQQQQDESPISAAVDGVIHHVGEVSAAKNGDDDDNNTGCLSVDQGQEVMINPKPLTEGDDNNANNNKNQCSNNNNNKDEVFEFIDIAENEDFMCYSSIGPPLGKVTIGSTDALHPWNEQQQQQEQPEQRQEAQSTIATSNNNIRELAKALYTKGLEESHTQLLDMTHNFPHFQESELLLGVVLGKGCFGTVHEIRGFVLDAELEREREREHQLAQQYQHDEKRLLEEKTEHHPPDTPDQQQEAVPAPPPSSPPPPQSSHSDGIIIRTWIPEEVLPVGDLESRRFMAVHALRKGGNARYAIKKLSPETINRYNNKDKRDDNNGRNKSEDDDDGGGRKYLVQAIADLVLEARILAAMEHPNIIKLRAIKAGDRFRPDFFIIMDRLYDTLAQRIEAWRGRRMPRKNHCARHRRGGISSGNGGGAIGDDKNLFRLLASPWSVLARLRRAGMPKEGSYQHRFVQVFHLSAAINYLHRNNVIHRDLKPENIGFDCRGDIKVFDLGMAKEMPHRNPDTSTNVYKFTGMCGSPRYMAPEVAHRRPYNEKCDVYSFAILVYEILSLQTAYVHHHGFDTMFAKVWGPPHQRPNLAKLQLPDRIHRSIYGAWHFDLHQRPTMQDIADALHDECLTFPNVTLQSLNPRRRHSKVIYDKEHCIFRVNSKLLSS